VAAAVDCRRTQCCCHCTRQPRSPPQSRTNETSAWRLRMKKVCPTKTRAPGS